MTSTSEPTSALIRQTLERHALRRGNRPAVIAPAGVLTFAELWRHAHARASEIGPRPGAVVTIPAASNEAFFVEVAAIWLAGAAPMPLDPKAPAPLREAVTRRLNIGAHTCQPWKAVLSVVGGTYRPLITGGEPPTVARKARAVGLGPVDGDETSEAHHTVALFASPMHLNGPFEFAVRQLLLGGTVAVLDRFDPRRWAQVAATNTASWAFLAPIQISRLLQTVSPRVLRTALAGVRTLLHSAAPCPPEIRRRLLDLVDAHRVAEFYGAAEYDGTFARADENASGALPIPGAQFRVVDPEHRPVPPGVVGVIEGRSVAGSASHYAGEPCVPAEVWRSVGDHGLLDTTGRLAVTSVDTAGRAIVGGVNVALSRVHAVIASHPAIVSCQVVPVHDDVYGQLLTARVTTDRPLTAETLRAYCATHLRPAERPHRLHLASSDQMTCDQPATKEADHAVAM